MLPAKIETTIIAENNKFIRAAKILSPTFCSFGFAPINFGMRFAIFANGQKSGRCALRTEKSNNKIAVGIQC